MWSVQGQVVFGVLGIVVGSLLIVTWAIQPQIAPFWQLPQGIAFVAGGGTLLIRRGRTAQK